MKHKRNWIIGIVLSATAAFVALQNVNAPTQGDVTPIPAIATTDEVTVTVVIDTLTPTFDDCAFTWAYHDAPELTEKVDAVIRALNEQATAHATFFGEDCIFADGHSTFGAMETDFYVRLPVDDLTATEEFGNWMAQVLEIIIQTPREEMQGPNYGFVEFWFEKNETEHIVLRVPIQTYLNEAQGKTGTELFQMFYNQP